MPCISHYSTVAISPRHGAMQDFVYQLIGLDNPRVIDFDFGYVSKKAFIGEEHNLLITKSPMDILPD